MPEALTLAPDFRDFLARRVQIGAADREIAALFMGGTRGDSDDAQDFFAMRDTDAGPRITYTTLERSRRTQDPLGDTSVRYSGKPGKVAQRVTGIENGNALNVFASAVVAALTPPPPVRLVHGEEIDDYFPEHAFCKCRDRDIGNLATSCMRGENLVIANRFQLWKDVAQLAVTVCPDCAGTTARCLVITDTNGNRWHNYIYAGNQGREHLNTFFSREDIRYCYGSNVTSDEKQAVRVEAHADGYPLTGTPSTDYFHYCSRCKTVGIAPCSQNADDRRRYGYRECIPHETRFPR